jgi:hypothetical protein
MKRSFFKEIIDNTNNRFVLLAFLFQCSECFCHGADDKWQ